MVEQMAEKMVASKALMTAVWKVARMAALMVE